MRWFLNVQAVLVCAILSVFPAAVFADPAHEGDIIVGVSATGQLVIEFDDDEQVALPAVSGLLFGFLGDEPGFLSIDKDEPDEDIFTLGAGANIVLEVIAFDDALKAWRPGFAGFLANPGDLWNIGAAPFDAHPFWHIDSTDAGFVAPPGQTKWSATFRLLDTGSTGYAPSDPITVTFTPEPGSLGLFAVGAIALLRRSRHARCPDRLTSH